MDAHIILLKAHRSAHRDFPDMPPGATYDIAAGVWMLGGKPLVIQSDSALGPAASKKADQETGEDRKGE